MEKCASFAHHGAWYARGSNLSGKDDAMEHVVSKLSLFWLLIGGTMKHFERVGVQPVISAQASIWELVDAMG